MKPLIPSLNPDVSRDLAAILDYYDVTDESARLQRLESGHMILRATKPIGMNRS